MKYSLADELPCSVYELMMEFSEFSLQRFKFYADFINIILLLLLLFLPLLLFLSFLFLVFSYYPSSENLNQKGVSGTSGIIGTFRFRVEENNGNRLYPRNNYNELILTIIEYKTPYCQYEIKLSPTKKYLK